MSIKNAAASLIKGGNASDGVLNMIEMAFRAYDPCMACATHSLSGHIPMIVSIFDNKKTLIQEIRQD
jgi:F420-non-reducing hydrogenase large subunit